MSSEKRLQEYEERLWESGVEFIAGVDEAGRGPLAGPVVAAAVVFPKGFWMEGIDDSKKLSAEKRDTMFGEIHKYAIGVGVASMSHEEIDRVNILQASLNAMVEAV